MLLKKLAYQVIETYDITHDHLAERIGKSRTSITNTLRLLNLDPQIQRWVIEGVITPGHARSILSQSDKTKHVEIANYIIKNNLSVRESEKLVKNWREKKSNLKSNLSSSKGQKDIEIKIAEEKIASKIQAKVTINGNSNKGKIVIDYFTLEELERMLEIFGIDMTN